MFVIEEVKDEEQKMAVVADVLKDCQNGLEYQKARKPTSKEPRTCKFGQPIRRVICLAL